MKEFKKDFEKFELKLKNNEPFALSRNNDGEMIILFNQYINNGEFIYDPNDGQYELFRKKMIEKGTLWHMNSQPENVYSNKLYIKR